MQLTAKLAIVKHRDECRGKRIGVRIAEIGGVSRYLGQ